MAECEDALDAAEAAVLRPKVYFGQIAFDSFFCVLAKGVGKVPFDPAQHSKAARRIAITCELTPLPSSGLQYTIRRELIAESPAWVRIILPSIKALKLTPKEVNGRFVQVEMLATGRRWHTDEGDEREETMPKVLAVFANEAECEAAAAAFFGKDAPVVEESPAVTTAPAAAVAAPAPVDPNRAALAQFLQPLWDQSGRDSDRFLATIAANPLLAQHFTEESPEVLALIGPF